MENIDTDRLPDLLAISEAAADLYLQKGYRFTYHDIADQTDLEVGEIIGIFPEKKKMISFYYRSLVLRYRLMVEEIDDFGEYLLAEKLSSFILSTFDMMEEKQAFVKATFKSTASGGGFSTTPFDEAVESLFREFIQEDHRVSASSTVLMNRYFYRFLRSQYIGLIRFWLNDDSEGKEMTMAFTDKFTSFIQELLYSAILDKGIDLVKFITHRGVISRHAPFLKKFTSTIEADSR